MTTPPTSLTTDAASIAPTASAVAFEPRADAAPSHEAPRPTLPDADEAVTALALLPDATLLATVCTLTARSNATLAALLAHLGEVGARGLHSERACPSLYTYCVYELRMSEDAAFRRARAAELVRRFPATFAAIARGELHLTGLLQLGPHLTEANVGDLLARARYRTRREIAALVAELAPRPDAPSVLEPLGPDPARGVRAPTHAEFTASLMGPVRTLPAGHAPADWLGAALALPAEGEAFHDDGSSRVGDGERDDDGEGERDAYPQVDRAADVRAHERRSADAGADVDRGSRPSGDGLMASEVRAANAAATPTPARRYRLQFTVSEAYVELLREVQALASHAVAPGDLAALHLRALEALAVTLRQRRHASRTPASRPVPDVPEGGEQGAAVAADGHERPSLLVRRGAGAKQDTPGRTRPMASANDGGSADGTGGDEQALPADPGQRGDETLPDGEPRQRGDEPPPLTDPRWHGNATTITVADASSAATARCPATAPGRSRYVAAAVRRVVWHRDEGCCTHVDDRGRRCAETRWLELHHLCPFARGGAATAENLTLRCRAHNALASEVDFGRERARRAWRRSAPRTALDPG